MNRIKIITALILLALVLALLVTEPGFFWDVACWQEWAFYIKEHGLRNTYKSTTNYLPLFHYELWLYAKMMATEQSVYDQIYILKIGTFIFDIIGLWFVYKWINKKIDFLLIFIFCAVNVAYLYNTVIWAQVDGIPTTLVFVSLYYGYNNKMLPSTVFFLLALNFKLQAIVFLPVWGLLHLNSLAVRPSLKNLLLPLLAMVTLECLILFPFYLGGDMAKVWSVIHESVGKYPVISVSAKNFWSLMFGGETNGLLDSEIWFSGISYKRAGIYMFLVTSFLALLPLLRSSLNVIKHRNAEHYKIARERLWLICALLITLFYFFNTQMHERYVHPAFIFIIAYAFYTRRVFLLVLFSITYFLTLEDFMHYLKLPNYKTLIFNDMFIAVLYVIIITYLYIRLFSKAKAEVGYNKPTA